ncbi:hypothetical protein F5144DRAFT_586505 [Chaetomium tenue]|uniref:Uncharacterized protein n=1 Tax=Chaetomium tenue TaxID=1854479 RepID=A0ACB7NVM7_9PEZI|nr:hypothetical protein F5144DRAFT_586505 [Chaetomium globosum]
MVGNFPRALSCPWYLVLAIPYGPNPLLSTPVTGRNRWMIVWPQVNPCSFSFFVSPCIHLKLLVDHLNSTQYISRAP